MPAARSFNGIPLVHLRLAHDHRRLADFVNAMSTAVFVTDEKGSPMHSNVHARKLLGAGIAGNGLAEGGEVYQAYIAGSVERYPSEDSPIARALQGLTSVIDDMEVHGPEGRIPLEVHGAPLLDAQGKVVLAIAVFKDITARRQLVARQLIAERLACFGALATILSHDVNNPLAVVIGNLMFALEELNAGIGSVEAINRRSTTLAQAPSASVSRFAI